MSNNQLPEMSKSQRERLTFMELHLRFLGEICIELHHQPRQRFTAGQPQAVAAPLAAVALRLAPIAVIVTFREQRSAISCNRWKRKPRIFRDFDALFLGF
jgi:hypothetical protein